MSESTQNNFTVAQKHKATSSLIALALKTTRSVKAINGIVQESCALSGLARLFFGLSLAEAIRAVHFSFPTAEYILANPHVGLVCSGFAGQRMK